MSVNIVKETVKSCNEIKEYIGIIVKYSKINNQLDPDLFNEQLLNYFESKNRFNQERQASFKTYLTTNLRNNLSNFIRDNLNDEEVVYNDEFLMFIEDNKKDTEQSFIRSELAEEILEEINSLDFKKRYIVKQRIFAGKTFKEIGEYFCNSKQNIAQLYEKTVSKLQQKFGDKIC